jgi:hypothetical protein
MRGYSISAVLCIHHPYYRNDDFLAPFFAERGIRFYSITPPPEKYGTVQEDGTRLGEWYTQVETMGEAGQEGQEGGGVRDVARWLDEEHDLRVEELDGMPKRTLDSVWWPFTQHGLVSPPPTQIAEIWNYTASVHGAALTTPDQQEGGRHGDRLGSWRSLRRILLQAATAVTVVLVPRFYRSNQPPELVFRRLGQLVHVCSHFFLSGYTL